MNFIIPLLCCILALVDVYEATTCKVVNGAAGECIDIAKCKPLLRIYTKKRRSLSERLYIEQSYCGNPAPSKFKVCCPHKSTWHEFRPNPVIFPEMRIWKPISTETKYGPKPKDIGNKVNAEKKELSEKENKETKETQDIEKPVQVTPVIETVVDPPVSPVCLQVDMTANYVGKACGVQSDSSMKITGGEATNIDEYPWLALLEYQNGALECGGSLINARFVLTAAHCIITTIGAPTKVRLSEYNTTSFPTDRVEVAGGGCEELPVTILDVQSVFTYPNYVIRTRNDIGLVKLAKTVVFSDFIKTICLPDRDFIPELKDGDEFIVAGWGVDETGSGSDVKKHVTIPYVPKDKCVNMRDIYSQLKRPLLDTHICAGGEEGRDSCRGDSGGPLMYQVDGVYYAIGIVSYGPYGACGQKRKPATYTHVYKYLDWIDYVIKYDNYYYYNYASN